MTTVQLTDELKRVTNENINHVKNSLLPLSSLQKNWKKDSETWSVNEIFAHVNEFSAYYHEAFRSRIEKTRFRDPKETFISSPLGKSAWKSMKLGNALNVKRKFKSQRSNNPDHHPELVKGNDLELFIEQQHELLQLIDLAATVNLRKAKVAVSPSPMIRLRLGDALLFVVYHNERHVRQALNLLKLKKFPQP